MTKLQRVEVGTVATILLAMLAFAFWLGSLQQRVNDLKPERIAEQLKAQKSELTAHFQQLAKDGAVKASVSTISIDFGPRGSGQINVRGPADATEGRGEFRLPGSFGKDVVGAFLVPFDDVYRFEKFVISITSRISPDDGSVTFVVDGRLSRDANQILKCHAVVLYR